MRIDKLMPREMNLFSYSRARLVDYFIKFLSGRWNTGMQWEKNNFDIEQVKKEKVKSK